MVRAVTMPYTGGNPGFLGTPMPQPDPYRTTPGFSPGGPVTVPTQAVQPPGVPTSAPPSSGTSGAPNRLSSILQPGGPMQMMGLGLLISGLQGTTRGPGGAAGQGIALGAQMMANIQAAQLAQQQLELDRRALDIRAEDLRLKREAPTAFQSKMADLGITPEMLATLSPEQRLQALSSGVEVNVGGQEWQSPEAKLQADINQARAAGDAEMVARLEAAQQKKTAPTEAQSKAFNFWSRMQGAQENIEELTRKNPDFNPGRVGEPGRLPVVGNIIASPEWRQYKSNAREWISGILRLDSGAAVPETEFWSYFETYFAQPGDDPATLADKERRRRSAENTLYRGNEDFFKSRLPAPTGDDDPVYQRLAPGERYIDPQTGQIIRKL